MPAGSWILWCYLQTNRGIRLRQGQKLNASFPSEVAGGLVMISFLLIVQAVDNTAFN